MWVVARFTVDGGSVTSVGLGGAQMGFSQELVQEFQVSTVNFDLSAGMTDAGAINVVTRAGGNQPHANIFYFFRDHNLAAYPALNRDQSNPDPFFQRQQFGFSLGGPIRRNHIFYFANWERNDQRSVGTTTLLTPEFAHLSRISRSPLEGTLFSGRLDARINGAHTVFVRYSQDASRGFGPAADHRRIAKRLSLELEPRHEPRRSESGWRDERHPSHTGQRSAIFLFHRQIEHGCPWHAGL